jgi:hypothetical protein
VTRIRTSRKAISRWRSGASGAVWTWLAEPCATWPVRADADRYTGPFDRSTSATILVVGITNDPATPYKSSVVLVRQLARSRLLTVQGPGHEVLFNTSTCANDYAAAYFVDGTLPAVGTTCAQDQPPF